MPFSVLLCVGLLCDQSQLLPGLPADCLATAPSLLDDTVINVVNIYIMRAKVKSIKYIKS